jgi:N-acetylmuramoyl-L-alanine amidase
VVVLDPGHDGGNASHPAEIDRQVPAGGFTKACDTTGTQTAGGYPEHAFTFDVALRVATLLRGQGLTVVLTRPDDAGVGPCVDERAAIGNRAGAAAVVSIHADGGPADGRGFHVLEPVGGPGAVAAIVAPSARLGLDLRDAFRSGTPMPTSTYVGSDGLMVRGDLAGLNLSTVPKVFIECGNMRNGTDAALLGDPAFRQQAAQAIAAGIARFVAT